MTVSVFIINGNGPEGLHLGNGDSEDAVFHRSSQLIHGRVLRKLEGALEPAAPATHVAPRVRGSFPGVAAPFAVDPDRPSLHDLDPDFIPREARDVGSEDVGVRCLLPVHVVRKEHRG
ncbi:hypothetical protein PIB30_015750 [Stylosanthes scabra]|uniref:Uncharacterized protein n=1 Tax=Stylosanthes scabra TaxID=79078 RepID=A0ABU6X572_9FABA|nr:hypothetical protein [Stylosanthes scabra]